MTPIDVYVAPECPSCDRAVALLAATGRPVRRRDLRRRRLTWDEVKHLAGLAGGVRHLLSVQAPAYRALGLARPEVEEPELVALMTRDPDLIRRPIVVADGCVLVGFTGAAPDRLPAGEEST